VPIAPPGDDLNDGDEQCDDAEPRAEKEPFDAVQGDEDGPPVSVAPCRMRVGKRRCTRGGPFAVLLS
jgi:hypothetical protein